MGQNLILNMDDHGYTVVAYNRTVSKVDDFLAKEAKGTKVIGAHSIEEMVSQLKRPRRVMMLVKAGKPVDEFIEQLRTPRSGRHHYRWRQFAVRRHEPAGEARREQRASLHRDWRFGRRRGRTPRSIHHARGSPKRGLT
jgi:hypothetical protein